MKDYSFGNILTVLQIATDHDRLRWESAPEDENELRAALAEAHVRFTRFPEGQDTALGRYTITLLDLEDRPVMRYYQQAAEDIVLATRFYWKLRRKVGGLDPLFEKAFADLHGRADNTPL